LIILEVGWNAWRCVRYNKFDLYVWKIIEQGPKHPNCWALVRSKAYCKQSTFGLQEPFRPERDDGLVMIR
jgi:hypothetical protein